MCVCSLVVVMGWVLVVSPRNDVPGFGVGGVGGGGWGWWRGRLSPPGFVGRWMALWCYSAVVLIGVGRLADCVANKFVVLAWGCVVVSRDAVLCVRWLSCG